MRIICDHCSLPIAGTVKRLVGNFNFHPQCLNEPRKEAERGSRTLPLPALRPSFIGLLSSDRAGHKSFAANTAPINALNLQHARSILDFLARL